MKMNQGRGEVPSSRSNDLQGSKIAVVGLGSSGESAARLALAKGAQVHVTDANNNVTTAARGAVLRKFGADVELGEHSLGKIQRADTVIVSPGIDPQAPVLCALRKRGVAWISEPEFACRFLSNPLIVVTGTNGKTTTAAICAHLLRQAGFDAALGGNVGKKLAPPVSELALAEPEPERIVLELSSFQLADTKEMTPDVGVMTNLGVDHLDRYSDVDAYHRDKRRLFEAGSESTTWVLNGDDEAVLEMAEVFPGTHLHFSLERPVAPGAYLCGQELRLELGGVAGGGDRPKSVGKAQAMKLLGRHNLANALAAVLAAVVAGAAPDGIADGLASFESLPHRLEAVGIVDGVLWVNDSKATNLDATKSALSSLDGPIVLLLGGSDKGEDFGELALVLGDKVKAVVAYGAAGPRISRSLEIIAQNDGNVKKGNQGGQQRTDGGWGVSSGDKTVKLEASSQPSERSFQPESHFTPIVELVLGSFTDAVAMGQKLAEPNDILLLSPACSSFDMFANYEARGDAFRQLATSGGCA